MARSSRDLGDDLARRLLTLERSRVEVERLHAAGALSRRACEHVYEGLFVAAFTAFERFLEDLFIGLLVQPHGIAYTFAAAHPRVAIRSHEIARELVCGPGRLYVDWLPYTERTLKLAKVYFRAGYPFTRLADKTDAVSKQVSEEMDRAVKLRNAIAHRSDHSMRQFEKHVIAGKSLLTVERRPAGYLRGFAVAAPPTTRFEVYAGSLVQAARILGG